MQFYVTLTSNCNLQCAYCYGKCCDDFGSDFSHLAIDYGVPSRISYPIDVLERFCAQDEDLTLIFYGGEPLLEIDTMKDIMDRIKAKRYMIQTNGVLLDQLDSGHVNRLHTILVSVDGDEETTDRSRGKGTYRKAVENVKRLRRDGFEGEIIARMTIDVTTDIRDQVTWLLLNRDCPFESVHWQLDALFWQNDYNESSIRKWIRERYNPSVTRLVGDWVQYMEEYGRVLRVYPLIAVARTLLFPENEKLRCGAGWTTFNIQTNGFITPCPVMAGLKDFYLGHISSTRSKSLLNAVFIKEPCQSCKILGVCGGRCLYANVTKLWGEQGFKLVCESVSNLVSSLQEAIPTIRRLMSSRQINPTDFDYPRFNSCEIIP